MNPHRLSWIDPNRLSCGEQTYGWALGYAFVDGSRCIEDGEILAHLDPGRSQIEATVAAMNGCFAAVLETGPAPLLITDRYGTIPIYLHRTPDITYASSDPWTLIAALDGPPELDELGALDLLRTGYATGTRTIVKGIETLPPATIMEIRPKGSSQHRYWTYGYEPQPMIQKDAEQQLANVLERVSRRTVDNAESRGYHSALTLSGGLDSRVLAATMVGPTQMPISAISYGSPTDPEVDVAREVAHHLGIEHTAVPIDAEYLNDKFLERSVTEVGMTTRFTCGVGARLLPASFADVFVPGHTGDFISGGHLPIHAGMVKNQDQLQHFLALKHFRYPGSEAALRRILRMDYDARKWDTLESTTSSFDFARDVFGLIDRWNVENRQRRLILMELRAYERLGRWMLPFYDHELVDFFAMIPHDLRFAQNLYVATANRHLLTRKGREFTNVRRVGTRSMAIDESLPRRIRRMQQLQPLSGWALQFGLVELRDLIRSLRPKTEQTFGTDPLKAWFKSNDRVREFVLDRVEGITTDLIDAKALSGLLLSDGVEERVYNRLLPGAITIDLCLDRAREVWQAARPS